MTLTRMIPQRWLIVWIYYLFVTVTGTKSARPRFDTSTDMGMVLVPADAEVDSVIFRLRATDQDADFPLIFDITATVTPIVRIDNLPCTLYNKVCQANVILIRRLTAGRLHDFAVRVRDSKGDSNSMQATISVTNATTPRDLIFPHIPALIMVPEDTKPGKELDYILVKSNPWSGKPVYIELWQPKELFTIQQRQTPTHTRGMITLIGELDFETQSMYTLTMYATDPYTDPKKDTRNIAGLQLVVIVKDVQDVPPIFTSAPPLTKINNTIQTGDVILRVHAEDGDKGVPREVTYGLVSEGNPFTPFFNISESTGEIVLARPLEQLTQITHIGAPIVLTIVAEEIRRSTDEPPAQATVVEVGLLLGEPGNSPPYFENDNYVAWMDENVELGSSLTFNDPYITKVHDEDIGKAGVFALKLENNNGTFEIGPTVAERTANFILTVRDNTLIDYEIYKSLRFKIIAQEVGPATNLSTSVPVTIFLRDINDNTPEFDEQSYQVTLSENITAGTRVIQVHATDKDTGLFGKIQYTGITGPGNEAFTIDPYTGIITVAMGTTVLDRELTSQLQLSVEARDENGQGLNGVVPLIVNLLDVNDNAPIFERDTYEFTLNDNSTNFTMPAIIKAFDNDAEPPNNQVRYELIHGNYDNKFILDNTTGELYIQEQIMKIRNVRNNPYKRFATKFKKTFGETPHDTTERTSTTTKLVIPSMISDTDRINDTNNQSGIEIIRQKREEKNILFTLTARAYDLGVPHLSGTTQINIISSPAAAARIVMFVVPGEHPDPIKTAQTLATITGGRITVQEIRPYTSQENLPNNSGNNLPSPESGKRSIVVARVEQLGPGASFVDIEKIRVALAANGVGVINDDMRNDDSMLGTDSRKNGGTINNTNTITSEEVTVYRAENKILTWLLTILGLLMIAAIIAVIVCCICPSCPFYMAPRKRRVHSSETLVAHSDHRPRRHIHRKYPTMMDVTWSQRKQAWSADPTRNWQFNRRNIKDYGIASLPGDVTRIEIDREREIPHETHSLHIRDAPIPMFVTEPIRKRRDNDQLYVEDMEPTKTHGYSMTNIDQIRQEKLNPTDRRDNIVNIRDQHYYREGNAEVMRLVTRGIEETAAGINQHHHHRNQPEIIIDQASVHRVDGKDILLRRFIEDQKLRINTHDYHGSMQELERQSMESHQRQKGAIIHQQHQQHQEILLIPEQLEHRHIEELGPDVQRLIIEHGPYEKSIRSEVKDTSQDLSARTLLIHGPMTKIDEKSPIDDEKQMNSVGNIHHYPVHDLELARQNALLTRLLLERDRGGVIGGAGVVLDTGSYLETQSLPGQVAAGTQTSETIATQTDQQPQQQPNRSRSDNDESEEEARMRRRLKSKKRYDGEPKRIRTLWMRSPIREEDRQYEKHTNVLRRKMKDIKDSRKISSIEPEVLKEISDSLDETGDTPPTVRQRFADSSLSRYDTTRDEEMTRREESSSIEMVKSDCVKSHKGRERSRERTRHVNEPSFRILEREMSSLSKKLSKLVGKKIHESEGESSEVGKLLTADSKEGNKSIHIDKTKPQKKIEIIKAKKSKYHQKSDGQSPSSKVQNDIEISENVSSDKMQKPKLNYRKKLSISTGSSELEDTMDKPKSKIATKVVEGESLKSKLIKNIKTTRAQLKRQMAIDLKNGKKTMGTRAPDTGKRKKITIPPVKTSIKGQKKLIVSADDSDSMTTRQIQLIEVTDEERTVQESDSGKNSDHSRGINDDMSMKQSGSSNDSDEISRLVPETLVEFDENKLDTKIEDSQMGKIVAIAGDTVTFIDTMKINEPSETISSESREKIIAKIETNTEDVMHTKEDIEKIISVPSGSADSPEFVSTVKLDEIVEQPMARTIEVIKDTESILKPESTKKNVYTEEKHFEEIVGNMTKMISPLKMIVEGVEKPMDVRESIKNNAKDVPGMGPEKQLADQPKISPNVEIKIEKGNLRLETEQINMHESSTVINDSGSIAQKKVDKGSIDYQFISSEDKTITADDVKSVEIGVGELNISVTDSLEDVPEEKLGGQLIDQVIITPTIVTAVDEISSSGSHSILGAMSEATISKTPRLTESLEPGGTENIEEDLKNRTGEMTVEKINESLPIISPKTILKISPPTISSDSLDQSLIATHDPVQSPADETRIEVIHEEITSEKPESLQNVSENVLNDNKEFLNVEEDTGNILTEEDHAPSVIDPINQTRIPDDISSASMEKEQLQLALEKLSIISQDGSRSSTPTRVVISRETSFLNSPRRQSIDEITKSPSPISAESAISITKSEQVDHADKSQTASDGQTILIDEFKSPTTFRSGTPAEELPSTSVEFIDTALDTLEEDSDVSSESSTQTAFIAQPYGTPRHRRLVRMQHTDNVSTDDQLEISETKHELSRTVDKISEQMSQGILSGDSIVSSDDTIRIMIEKSLDMNVKSPELIDEKIIIETLPEKSSVSDYSIGEISGNLLEKIDDKFENEDINKSEDIQIVTKSEFEAVEKPESSEGSLTDVTAIIAEEKSTEETSDANDQTKHQDQNIVTTPEKVESIIQFDTEQLAATVDDTSIADNSKEIKVMDEELQPLPTIPIEILDTIKKKDAIKSDSNGESKTCKVADKSRESFKEPPSKHQQMSKGRAKSLGNIKNLPRKEKNVTMFDKTSDRIIRTRDMIKRQSSVSNQLNEPLKHRKKFEHEKNLTDGKLKDGKLEKERKTLHKQSKKEVNIDDKRKSAADNLPLPKKKGRKNLEKIPKIGGMKIVSSNNDAGREMDGSDSIPGTVLVDQPSVHSDIDESSKQIEVKSIQQTEEMSHPSGSIDVKENDETFLKASQLSETDTVDKLNFALDEESKNEEILLEHLDDVSTDIPSISPETTTPDKKLKIKQEEFDNAQKIIMKHNKDEHMEAQSRYMAWYKHNREETERRKRERKSGDDESEEPPKWLRKSTRQRWLKMSPEDRKIFGAQTPEVTPLPSRRKIQPLINNESEQLKAIVRQGRKIRRATGDDYDPPIEIFAPEKPPTPPVAAATSTTKYHYLIQHSEYKYEKIPPPFYLHPPPVPQSSPRSSIITESQLPCTSGEFQRPDNTNVDIDTGIVVPMPGTNRLRHQQLLEKKSVFDIAYSEAAPSHLRADSTTPPS